MIDWITELDHILELLGLTSECDQEFVDLKTTLYHGSVHLIPTSHLVVRSSQICRLDHSAQSSQVCRLHECVNHSVTRNWLT